jgi:Icc protein
MLIAQLSDVDVGGSRYREELLRSATEEVNVAAPDLAGDLTDDGYPDQYPLAVQELAALTCPRIVRVPGNHDARNVGYLRVPRARLPAAARVRRTQRGARRGRLVKAGSRRGRDQA